MSFSKVILVGRIGENLELKQTQNGISTTTFSLAVDRKGTKGADKVTDWFTIVAWRERAEFICKYFGRGKEILICGELQTRSWVDQNTGGKRSVTEVVASEVSFVSASNATEGANVPTDKPSAKEAQKQGTQMGIPYLPQNYGGQSKFEVIEEDASLPF